jgi:fluoride exporter
MPRQEFLFGEQTMMLLGIAIGGAVGSVLRYLIGISVQRVAHTGFPVGTLAVNLVGCVLVGALAAHFLNDETQPMLRAALTVGFCGGFTTFSTFTLETLGLIVGGDWPKAAAYIAASMAACIAGTAGGFRLVHHLHR